jgi:hypothetical protein
MTDEIKPVETETKKHPLLAARDKVKGFFKNAFAPTPPPPCEYQVVRFDGEAVPDIIRLGGLGATMTDLARDGWRFLAITSDGVLMGRNHRSHVVVDGEVQIYHRNNSSTPYDYGYRSRERCNHEPERKPKPDDGEKTIHIPEFGDGQFPISKPKEEEHKAVICANDEKEEKAPPFFTGLKPILLARKTTEEVEQEAS